LIALVITISLLSNILLQRTVPWILTVLLPYYYKMTNSMNQHLSTSIPSICANRRALISPSHVLGCTVDDSVIYKNDKDDNSDEIPKRWCKRMHICSNSCFTQIVCCVFVQLNFECLCRCSFVISLINHIEPSSCSISHSQTSMSAMSFLACHGFFPIAYLNLHMHSSYATKLLRMMTRS